MAVQAFKTIEWTGRAARIIDQTLLPGKLKYLNIGNAEEMWEAIRSLRVRGAPAIGVAAGYGAYLGVRAERPRTLASAREALREVADFLATSRPTAVNLFWGIERMRSAGERVADGSSVEAFLLALLDEAIAIHDSDIATCAAIALYGAPLLKGARGVLTHCNAGALATGGSGTAVGVIVEAARRWKFRVFADETRPLLQGARLTTWELLQAGIETTLITDSMAASVMARGEVQAIVVGADRIAASGDTANKIGTMPLAICAAHFKVPFYVAAPISTIDIATPDGAAIPIEERNGEEIANFGGTRTAPKGVGTFNPAFDVTPARFIAAIVTEAGVLRAPYGASIRRAATPSNRRRGAGRT